MTAPASPASPGKIFLYFSPLTLLVYLALPHAYLLDIATSYMLKDQLHASATQVSTFRLLTAIPVYLSFVFGFARDRWNPLGMKDRGLLLIFAPLTAAVFLWMSASTLSYGELFIGMLSAMFFYRFIGAAYQGLLALIGQEQLMSGRLAVLWQIVSSVPYVIGGFASGWVAQHLPPSRTFLFVAIVTLLIAAYSFVRPRAVFAHAYDRLEAKQGNLLADIKRLLSHRAIYPAVLIMFMFQFSPGSNTPLQFYLTDKLHGSDAIYGDFNAIFAASFVPVFFLYGWLCKKVSLRALLWWGTIITVPQMVPLAFIHSPMTAVILAAPIGMLGGIAAAAYYDLSIRSCPPGLQGTLMMLVDGFLMLSYRGGDLLGAHIYLSSPENGFLYCVIATTAVYAAILPVLLLIPKQLIATRDGERNPEVEREMAAEIAAVA
ncbi:MAG: MFS transporter [Alphaproteobacteria bacterium]|nr:MFS transporter [Alphaproteobacteria bacterium]